MDITSIKHLNVKCNTIKLIQNNAGKYTCELRLEFDKNPTIKKHAEKCWLFFDYVKISKSSWKKNVMDKFGSWQN